MVWKRTVLIAVILAGSVMHAQKNTDPQFIKDSIEIAKVKLVKPQFKFDNRVTFHEGQAITINGFEAGLLLVEKLRVTLGYYGMSAKLKAYDQVIEDQKFGKYMQLYYGSLNLELIYKDMRFFSWGMPLEIAAGYNKFQDKNLGSGEVLGTKAGAIIFANFGLSGTYKPMRFLGLKGILGYRKVAFNQVKDFAFDGFFTSVGLNVDVSALVSAIRMYKLKKRYQRGNNVKNAVEILTD
jgi:hypothetical protein